MAARIFGWLACVGAVALLVVAMITGTTPVEADPAAPPRVVDAWIRLAAVPGRPAAGYFTLVAGAAPVRLTGVSAPPARVELHAMTMAGGVMRMDRLPVVAAGAGASVRFAPGGAHLMLFDLPPAVRPGATLPLVFTFADGATVTAAAAVRTAGAAPPMAMPGHGAR